MELNENSLPVIEGLTVPVTEVPGIDEKEIKGIGTSTMVSRLNGWERKLLDLSLRNVMLNLKPGKVIVPILEHDTAKVVEYIKAGKLSELIGVSQEDNTELLKGLYRAARTTMEENGANSLFMSLGILRWYDIDDPRPHIAPLLFIPVEIVRKKAMAYEIHQREDDVMVNVTLIEMLRQMFGVTFPELEVLPEDASGFVDWSKIFDTFAAHVNEINKRQPDDRKWKLPVKSFIGIFSFKKFLLWHDLHLHPQVVESNPVVRGLIENRYSPMCGTPIADARSIEADSPASLMLPLDYDSSQLEAVAACHAGQSFVLHGPPGTGKSQTITNMIADALYSGKRVLFVAEKKAALDVVRSRLNSIGLGPYCLELHSNMTDKRSFFSQLRDSGILRLGSHIGSRPRTKEYGLTNLLLSSTQKHLREIVDAIHAKREFGQSLYDYVNSLLITEYSNIAFKNTEIAHLSPENISVLCAALNSLDLAAQILGFHPGTSELVGLYPTENTSCNQRIVTESLARMPVSIARARKKAMSLINRLFLKHSPEEILANDPIWKQLNAVAAIDDEKYKDIDTFENYVNRWNTAIDNLRIWYHFSVPAALIYNYNIPAVLNYYLEGNSGIETAKTFHSAYYRAMALNVIDNDSHLRGFSGILQNNNLRRYTNEVIKFQEHSREELLRKMEEYIVDVSLSPQQERQLSILSRRVQTNGRGIALRRVIEESGEVLEKLFPCMLMSPLSVAQYLNMNPDLFDIVIFDEASQIETPDAVGAISRGRALVVVGDPLQLPPTRFFTSQNTGGEEIQESEDSNSILEDCIALGMPSRYLSRHYRSRHESLIAFSNRHFYLDKLLTFPSHNDAERKVSFIDPNGIYDYGKSRTNRIEAEAVVKHIIGLLELSETNPSIGVVAFSKAQSNLIEDILYKKLQRNKILQQKIESAPESLFIKNLENVQGDERDIIIFSIGYGPDENGKVSLNFGPLNQSGGEKRLNVAVSRAKEEMIVFSSLHPRHIPSEGIAAKGVTALRDFLQFAIDGTLDRETQQDNCNETIIDDIAAKLRNHGLNVVTKVGRSSYKIDIAIVDDKNPVNYLMGIMLDGREYYKLPTVRDREITVPRVLRSLGWNIYRLWIIDWLENPSGVIKDVLRRLDDLSS